MLKWSYNVKTNINRCYNYGNKDTYLLFHIFCSHFHPSMKTVGECCYCIFFNVLSTSVKITWPLRSQVFFFFGFVGYSNESWKDFFLGGVWGGYGGWWFRFVLNSVWLQFFLLILDLEVRLLIFNKMKFLPLVRYIFEFQRILNLQILKSRVWICLIYVMVWNLHFLCSVHFCWIHICLRN